MFTPVIDALVNEKGETVSKRTVLMARKTMSEAVSARRKYTNKKYPCSSVMWTPSKEDAIRNVANLKAESEMKVATARAKGKMLKQQAKNA